MAPRVTKVHIAGTQINAKLIDVREDGDVGAELKLPAAKIHPRIAAPRPDPIF